MTERSMNAEYERIRSRERAAQRSRVEQAYADDPRLAQIEQERREAVQGLALALRQGESFTSAEAQSQQILLRLDEEQRQRLAALGLAPDHLELHYRCDICRDTGYVGEVRRTPCACLVRRRLKAASESCGVREDERFETFRLDIFEEEGQRSRMEQARRICETYAEAIAAGQPEQDILLLLGNTGLGKSFLINCIANRVLERGETRVKKVTAFQLIQDILAGIRAHEDASAAYISPRLLFVDDLGTEPQMHNITQEYLFSIVNERQEAGRATVIASNLGARELQARYGDRIFSRLFDAKRSRALLLTGKSLRMAQR